MTCFLWVAGSTIVAAMLVCAGVAMCVYSKLEVDPPQAPRTGVDQR